MPPRRPGGKYKGLITRTKTDAALAAEADARAKKRQEEVLKRAAMRKQREKMDREGVGPDAVDPEEEKRQRILNLLMGGRRGDTKKFFQAWKKGAAQQRKEMKIHEREIGWKRHCNGMDPDFPKNCNGMKQLLPSSLTLPLNNFLALDTGDVESFRASRGRDYRMGMSGMSDKLKQATLSRAMGFLPEIKDRHAGHAHGRSQERVEEDRWFGPESEIQTVARSKSGELCFLDTRTMRIRHCPVEFGHVQVVRRRSSVLDLQG
ncbi:unnamed protein product [Durusdinium trenchii]